MKNKFPNSNNELLNKKKTWEKTLVYPFHFYETKEGEQAADQIPASEPVKKKTITG